MQPFKAPRKHNEKASPIRQSSRRQRKQDSEEETALGLVCVPWVIKETQYNDMEEQIDNGKHDKGDNGKQSAIEDEAARSFVVHPEQPVISSTVASPSCSEFEAFLDRASVAAGVPKNKMSKTDVYWENVLQSEKERFTLEHVERDISVDDIMLGDSSDDDEVPIVSTVKNSNLTLLVDVATQSVSSPTLRKKKAPKVRHRNPDVQPIKLTLTLHR